MRFLINTTVGVLGIFDVAKGWGYPDHDSDFGITLALWGVPEGPFLFLPVLGPSDPRDAAGFGVDIAADPFTWVGQGTAVRRSTGAASRSTRSISGSARWTPSTRSRRPHSIPMRPSAACTASTGESQIEAFATTTAPRSLYGSRKLLPQTAELPRDHEHARTVALS